jgi:hypothetical protein
MEPNQTTRQLWAAIEGHFTANQAPRTIFLSHSFHTMTQGDLTVQDYGKKMKKAADALRDVGIPVDAPTLLLNLLHGVNSRFSTAADIIAGTAGMTFSTALDQLKLKELRLENEAKVEATNALVALSTLSGSTSSGCTGSTSTSRPRKSPLSSRCSSSHNRATTAASSVTRRIQEGAMAAAATAAASSFVPPTLMVRGFASIRRLFRGCWAVAAADSGAAARVYSALLRKLTPPLAPARLLGMWPA